MTCVTIELHLYKEDSINKLFTDLIDHLVIQPGLREIENLQYYSNVGWGEIYTILEPQKYDWSL